MTINAVLDALGSSAPSRIRQLTVTERGASCPVHSGKDGDELSWNLGKQIFYCRKSGDGGDPLAFAAHLLDMDIKRDFIRVCEAVLGRSCPGEEAETPAERAEREAAALARAKENEAKEAERVAEANRWRERAARFGREAWERARRLDPLVASYMKARSGIDTALTPGLRLDPASPFSHPRPGGRRETLFTGPAMIAPFVDPITRAVTGCHRTWIDMNNGPKFRPTIWIITAAGREAGVVRPSFESVRNWHPPADADPAHFEALPAKKMLGIKKGSVIPVCGRLDATRWVIGEGIETVAAFAVLDGAHRGSFYGAAGDIGNMAGARDPGSDFWHPTLKKADAAGRMRRVRVAGPVPAEWRAEDGPAALVVPDHVRELVLLGDGDSERVATASAMVRAETRHARDGRTVRVVWPGRFGDFAEAVAAVHA